MIKEEVLWVLWQHLSFDISDLKTTDGETVFLKDTGKRHANAGPDFSMATVTINGIEWTGDIEIHVRSSDWLRHRHDQNPAFESVILHVVYEHDAVIRRKDNTLLPVLELKNRISESFW